MLKIIDPKDSVHELPSYNWKKPLKRKNVKIEYKIIFIAISINVAEKFGYKKAKFIFSVF